jgi:hypothetical protein
MENVTILIQGKVTQETYNFYVEAYPQTPIVVSTWSDNDVDLSYFPHNLKLVKSRLPKINGEQNMNYQFVSTLNGLGLVDTEYVIKVRGDEYYSNFQSVYEQLKSTPNKILSAPIFFRHFSHFKYHISDHIIAGKTSEIKFMFGAAKYAFDNSLLYHEKNGKRWSYWEPEINLTMAYLMAKYPTDFHDKNGPKLMVEHFDIIDLPKLKPYKVVANIFRKFWYSDFNPYNNESINDIKELLNEHPPYNR